ncbi:MAG: hypothetical protein ABIJ23_04075 [Candidatus Magasanikbacteria bacterium]
MGAATCFIEVCTAGFATATLVEFRIALATAGRGAPTAFFTSCPHGVLLRVEVGVVG